MTDLSITVLGNASGGVPGAGNAGSGYLVRADGTAMLVDCGNGVLGNLKKHAPYEDVEAVYVSHLHADHALDLAPLALQFRFTRKKPVPLYGPEGLRTLLYRWLGLFFSDPDPYVQAFDVREIAPWSAHDVGGIRFQACPVEHNVPALGYRAKAAGEEKRVFYSADTRAGGLVTEGAQGADLFLADATFQDLPPGKDAEKSRAHHMTAREAAEVATRAGVSRLALTHLMYLLDADVSLKQAREAFDGPVSVAKPGDVFVVEGRS